MKKIYFIICCIASCMVTNAQVTDSAKRVVKLQGAINVRDIGGYKTSNGKTVQWGKVYRSAEINNLTEADLQKLESLSINYVLDFRGIKEAEPAPDKLPKNAIRISLSAGSNSLNNGAAAMMKMMREAKNGDSLMMQFYTVIDSFQYRYKPMFETLLEQPKGKAVLYHCTAGKDRTGIATALILHALGVDEETIIQDYLASNIYRQAYNEKLVSTIVKMYQVNEAVAKSLMGVKREYLQATFNTIKQQYGSVDNYLEQVMGLDKKNIDKLRDKFIEP